MSVNDPIFLGLNTVELVSLPIMLAMFVFAVWYGIVRGADGSPVLWRRKEPRPAEAPPPAPAERSEIAEAPPPPAAAAG